MVHGAIFKSYFNIVCALHQHQWFMSPIDIRYINLFLEFLTNPRFFKHTPMFNNVLKFKVRHLKAQSDIYTLVFSIFYIFQVSFHFVHHCFHTRKFMISGFKSQISYTGIFCEIF